MVGQHNHQVVVSEQQQAEEMARRLMESSTNFDEVLPEPVMVRIVEFVEYEAELNGQKVYRRKPVQRVAEINTYVPLRVLHKMMASQEKIRRIQAARANPNQIDGAMQQEMIDWITQQVLSVWKLTEPDMTAERLQEGLDLKKIMGLFSLFFGNLQTGMGSPAA